MLIFWGLIGSSHAALGQSLPAANQGNTHHVNLGNTSQEELTRLTADEFDAIFHPPARSELNWPTAPRMAALELLDPGSPQNAPTFLNTPLDHNGNGPILGLMLDFDMDEQSDIRRGGSTSTLTPAVQEEAGWAMAVDREGPQPGPNDARQIDAFSQVCFQE